jgi:hypothetical protein
LVTECGIQVLDKSTEASKPARTPVNMESDSCLESRLIEILAVSPVLKTLLSVESITVEKRQIGVEESHVVLGAIDTCTRPLPTGD